MNLASCHLLHPALDLAKAANQLKRRTAVNGAGVKLVVKLGAARDQLGPQLLDEEGDKGRILATLAQ